MNRFAPGGSSSGFGLGSKTPAAMTPTTPAPTVAAAAMTTRSQVERMASLLAT
jgi:hypothetical protein